MAAGINQLADRHLSQGRALAKLANLSHNLAKVLLLTSVGWNQFSNRPPTWCIQIVSPLERVTKPRLQTLEVWNLR